VVVVRTNCIDWTMLWLEKVIYSTEHRDVRIEVGDAMVKSRKSLQNMRRRGSSVLLHAVHLAGSERPRLNEVSAGVQI